MKQTSQFIRIILLLAIALLTAGHKAQAQNTYSVSASVSGTTRTFTITRSGNTRIQEKVLYRTVSLTAVEGKNFTRKVGSVTFAPGEDSKTVDVNETAFNDVLPIYKYQYHDSRNYRFEVTDEAGFLLASEEVVLNYGTSLNPDRVSTGGNDHVITDLVRFSNNGHYDSSMNSDYFQDIQYDPATNSQHVMSNGYVKVDDEYNYNNKTLCTIPTAGIFDYAKGSPAYHKAIGNMLYATVCFTMKEENDGYQYIQILADNSTTWDGSGNVQDPTGGVNDPDISIYKACFELSKTGDVMKSDNKMYFPHQSDNETGWRYYVYDKAGLHQQKFKSHTPSFLATNSGSLVLDPTVSTINVRFDASGKDNDTWYFKNLFVRLLLFDDVAPTLLNSDIFISPGPYAKGNTVTIGIPFSEAVQFTDHTYELHTTWGDFRVANANNFIGTNVVYFTGEITANDGTQLQILNFIPASPIFRDSGIYSFGGSVQKTFSSTYRVETDHYYLISYVTNGGTLSGSYPTSYSHGSSDITLPGYASISKDNCLFAGWYDNPSFEGSPVTIIPTHSFSDKTFYAKWVDNTLVGSGTENDPYIITAKEQLDLISLQADMGNSFYQKFFRLDADIDFPHTTAWDQSNNTEDNFTPIAYQEDNHGNNLNTFSGTFDGCGHTISGLRIFRRHGHIGLFGSLSGTVKNLVISDACISGEKFTGAIAGYANGMIENCRVTSTVRINNPSGGTYKYHGGIVGGKASTSAKPLRGCISSVRLSTTGATDNGGSDFGGIAGETFNSGIIRDCFGTGVTFPAARYFSENSLGAISGRNGFNCTFTNNYYLNCHVYNSSTAIGGVENNDMDGARTARAILTDEYVTATPAGAYTEYDVSGITAYECGAMAVGGVLYSGSSQTFGITLSHTGRPGCTFIGYNVQNGTLHGNETDGYTLTVGNGDVTISAEWVTANTVNVSAKSADGLYWTTFYNANKRFFLPEGAQAFTMGADHQLYSLGANGRIIPAATAVIIVGREAELILTEGSGTAPVTIHGGSNILQASSTDVNVAGLSGTPYVLGKINDTLGFYRFTGSIIPAGKAYYVVTQ